MGEKKNRDTQQDLIDGNLLADFEGETSFLLRPFALRLGYGGAWVPGGCAHNPPYASAHCVYQSTQGHFDTFWFEDEDEVERAFRSGRIHLGRFLEGVKSILGGPNLHRKVVGEGGRQ